MLGYRVTAHTKIQKGSIVNYSDHHVQVFTKMRDHYIDLSSVTLTVDTIADYNCVLPADNHDDLTMI